MSNFIKSYFGNNFMGSESNISYTAGMNFTNLIIAIPLLTTLLLLIINKFKLEKKFSSIVLFFIFFNLYITFNTVIISILISLEAVYLTKVILKYFRLCCNSKTEINFESIKQFANIVKLKVATLSANEPAKNILISGHWGSGKSHFVKNILPKTINSSVYVSCTDYSDIIDLVNDLIQKSNPWMMRIIIRFSLSKLLSIISKTELRQYIGREQVIIFDEFERLVDYNKIDHMHIVSLIQYLNHEKNCVCILVANEDHLNDASQFINVREKLISAIYHYKLPFDDILKIIKGNHAELTISLDEQPFSRIYQSLNKWYQIDNNIRMIEHLYIKINQLYQAYSYNIKVDNFLESYIKKNGDQKNKLFIDLFSYVETVIIQLYYLYLKNPYYLQLIGQFAEIYHQNSMLDKSELGQIDQQNIQQLSAQLSALYVEQSKYQNDNYILLCFNKIQESSIFANIDQRLLTNFISNNDFIRKFLKSEAIELQDNSQDIQSFMQKFKELLCESEDSSLVISYFKTINIFEARYLNVADKQNEDNTELFHTIYDYLRYQLDENQPKAIRINGESYQSYINALTIYMLLPNKFKEQTLTNDKNLLSSICSYYRYNESLINNLFYNNTFWILKSENVILPFINLLSKTATEIISEYKSIEVYEDMLIFLNIHYNNLIFGNLAFNTEVTHECNKAIISLLDNTLGRSNKSINLLFDHLYGFNKDEYRAKNFEQKTLPTLVNKIKEIYSTNELKQEFIDTYKNHALNIPKQVAEALQTELDTATEQPSNQTQKNPDNNQ